MIGSEEDTIAFRMDTSGRFSSCKKILGARRLDSYPNEPVEVSA